MLIPYESKATQRLRFAIHQLTIELDTAEAAIDAFHRAMYAFEREYQQRLGDLAESVLILRSQLGLHERNNKAVVVATQLADHDYRQLKTAYRQACKRCHPDYLPDEYREAGLHLFDALNKAYHLQDIVTVEHILWLLQSGQAFSETTVFIHNQTLLEKRHQLLQQMITQKQDQLEQLKMREEYDVSNRDNWNILLYDYQMRLEDELAVLRGKARTLERASRKN